MFVSLTSQLHRIRDTGVMWSPTFNERAADVVDRPALLGNLTALFVQLPRLSEVANQVLP